MKNRKFQPDPNTYRRVVTSCTCANLRKTAQVITQLYDDFLQPSGLTNTQFRLLGAVAANGPIAITPLAQQLELDRTTLARNLQPLERGGLVVMTTGEDRRTHLVTLTEKGQDALMQALPLWEEAQAWVISQLGEDRWRAMFSDWLALVELVQER